MAGEIGLVGLAIFLWLLYRLFSENFRIYRRLKDDYLKVVSISLIACFFAFLVNGLTETSLYYSRVSMIFWYLIGVSFSLNKLSDQK
jgi:cell division protein FtsW (lipid II flippase)